MTSIESAVYAVRSHFADTTVSVTPDGVGGVYVTVEDVAVGSQYLPTSAWMGFQINGAYPQSDVYPHYLGRVARRDGAQHGPAVQLVMWQGREALQLSRRSSRWNPALDNAALKAQKVLSWFADQ